MGTHNLGTLKIIIFSIIVTSLVWIGILAYLLRSSPSTQTFPNNVKHVETNFNNKNEKIQKEKKKKEYEIEILDEDTPMEKDELALFVSNMNYAKELNKKYDNNVDIKPSSIPKSGMGLFAARDFKKDERILFAVGDFKTFENIDEHYDKVGQTFRELSTINGRFYIIPGKDDKWSYINHKYRTQTNTFFNEQFFNFTQSENIIPIEKAPHGSQVVSITASKPVKKGEELFIDYGENYDYESAGFKRK